MHDEFLTLTGDEMLVLFCFLCSDSGPPDFNDTEWLDLLNGIRRDACDKENLVNMVTPKEAQQTLDRLKSRDFLWEDQDKITEETKDCIMFTIAQTWPAIPFIYSSYNTASVYLRSMLYRRRPGEKCICGVPYNKLLILRLQMNILTHATMKDSLITFKVSHILRIPIEIVGGNEIKKKGYLETLKQKGEGILYKGRSSDREDHVTWLWRYDEDARPDIVRSCIGLHPHWDIYVIDNKAYRKPNKYHQYKPAVRCLLYCVLLVDQYTFDVNHKSHKEVLNKLRERYFTDIPLYDKINVSKIPDGIIYKRDGGVTFISENIRHDVMYAFVTECLVEDSDLEFFLTTASRDVVSEYCRSWGYESSEGERCVYVPEEPEKMYDLFIDKLQLDIIILPTMNDKSIYHKIIYRLKITEEVLGWDIDARKRYIELSKKGRKSMYRARGMIVGCAGAGKTTLLRQLQRKQTHDCHSSTETTVGLEIHEDLFEIKDGTLIDTKKDEFDFIKSQGKQIISMTDFAGQVAYYACHQIYLSRRAFYLVVMDMSKRLDEVVHTQDTDRHNPIGSLFHGWTYKDYFLFWLRSIKTYCGDGNRLKTKANPIIVIASHLDCIQFEKVETHNAQIEDFTFYDKLEECLPGQHLLKDNISKERYFEIQCPPKKLNEDQLEVIENVRKCIVKTASRLAHWGEQIPVNWTIFEDFVQKNKEKRILSRSELQNISELDSLREIEKEDMLRYFKEIGLIIYFAEKNLKESIIVDVQWFVDAFKNIITDPTHARSFCKSVEEWKTFMSTGKITDSTLAELLSEQSSLYVFHKSIIIQYMEKLGILATIQTQEGKMNDPLLVEHVYYIPSINRTEFSIEHRKVMDNVNKTPVLVFSFKTFIPHFFFFRLVALCFSVWEPLRDDLLCKNVAFYKSKGGHQRIAIAVNKSSIQLQVFTPDDTIQLRSEKTKEIRVHIENMIKDITTTFHHQVLYKVGYPCRDITITDEDEYCFLSERTVAELETNEIICPNYIPPTKHERHKIVRDELLYYWYTDPEKNIKN
ncbi:uncharacterized protein LOC134275697 [Saccostrea cucullata]|uniref:uncharacterized protein LOC134275697 n=1 Tax=Saccostrea cuccullata TaxID=36930 RepID=UPI002ED02140